MAKWASDKHPGTPCLFCRKKPSVLHVVNTLMICRECIGKPSVQHQLRAVSSRRPEDARRSA